MNPQPEKTKEQVFAVSIMSATPFGLMDMGRREILTASQLQKMGFDPIELMARGQAEEIQP